MSQQVAEIRTVEMPKDMQEYAVRVATDAMNTKSQEWEIAKYVREEFDRKYKGAWHCIVGQRFGGSVPYEANNFIYFYMRKRTFMLYRYG